MFLYVHCPGCKDSERGPGDFLSSIQLTHRRHHRRSVCFWNGGQENMFSTIIWWSILLCMLGFCPSGNCFSPTLPGSSPMVRFTPFIILCVANDKKKKKKNAVTLQTTSKCDLHSLCKITIHVVFCSLGLLKSIWICTKMHWDNSRVYDRYNQSS